ncbi:hypothetical protein [uncultured Corynebacterium sp.]|uniref:hypothetical protein n=1 Tax=uncultured Corynebacterium sp. TaxID=159447 RepID=UPI0025F99199|nr:hypothetical protein [uncultured Corynebacterium sp.]
MKRITAAALAATTALSLAAVPAQAEEGTLNETLENLETAVNPKKASEVNDAYLAAYIGQAKIRERLEPGTGYSGPYKGSSDKNLVPKSATSSLKNDAARGYKVGTTYDILVGTGIAAGVLALVGAAAAAAGKIPGLPGLPGVQLPF